MNRKTILMIAGFVALNAALFGAYHIWSGKHRAKLNEINAAVAAKRAIRFPFSRRQDRGRFHKQRRRLRVPAAPASA